MCEWTDRQYSCGHHRVIAAMWCSKFIRIQLRCQPPQVENREYRPEEICTELEDKKPRILNGEVRAVGVCRKRGK
ncbi:hypothetical protein RB594_003641 [Gaeumannomyces avenae]